MHRFVACMLVVFCCVFKEAQCCGGNLKIVPGETVYIHSDNYPKNYDHNQNCTWVIPNTAGYKIHLQFLDLKLEYHDTCSYDFVKVKSDKKFIGLFCDDHYPPAIAPAPSFTVQFMSDPAVANIGFRMAAKLIDINECSRSNGLCEHKCTNHPGFFKCSCNAGFALHDQTKCIDVNECAINNGGCDHDCTNTQGSFNCTCRQGFVASGTKCIDVDECLYNNKGRCDQICTNTPGSYNCSCFPGFVWEGNACRELCPNAFCNLHGICEIAGNSKTCSCFGGWQGLHCEMEKTAKVTSAETDKVPAAVLGVFVGILGLLLVALALLHVLYKRSQGTVQVQGSNGSENPVYFEKNEQPAM